MGLTVALGAIQRNGGAEVSLYVWLVCGLVNPADSRASAKASEWASAIGGQVGASIQ